MLHEQQLPAEQLPALHRPLVEHEATGVEQQEAQLLLLRRFSREA
jgi:hypothetical protein